jgi:exopolysaccharide biosynthesis polyprenyl glycosylphosphotransferase
MSLGRTPVGEAGPPLSDSWFGSPSPHEDGSGAHDRCINDGCLVDAPDLLDFDVDEVGTAPIAGDQWPVAWLLAVDLVAAAIALPLALLLLATISPAESNSLSNFWSNVRSGASFPVAIVIALALAGFYRSSRRARYESSFSELKELAVALCAGFVLSIGFSVLLHLTFSVTESNSTQLLLAAIVAVALITIAHATLSAFRRDVHSRVLIVGSGSLVDRIATYFSLTKGVEVAGRVVDASTAEDGSLGTVNDLPQLCEKFQANRIIVAFPTVLSHDSVTVFRSLPSSVHIAIVPRYFELVSWRSRITDLFGLPLVEVAPAHFSRWDRFLKRGFDIIAGSLLLIVLSPVALILAVLVKLSSPGPVLFRQERAGQGRHPFTIYKFRTMVDGDATQTEEPETGAQNASIPLYELRNKKADVERITPIGSFMRRTGLDEIPQFLNVLLGNMSIVGPRPFTECESETFTGWQARRFELRPGITGLWQVSGRNDLSKDDLRRLDYLYVASWSLWWDVKIVWDTPRAMVRGFGAY